MKPNARLFFSILGLLGLVTPARAQSTTLVSQNSDGVQANAPSTNGVISADGRYVAFESAADNLASPDTLGYVDVFVRDRLAGTTQRVSVAMGGGQATAPSAIGAISRDGRYVAFLSLAPDLVPGDSNSKKDVFVRDLVTGVTTLVSVSSAGVQGNNDSFQASSISDNGRFVAFASGASNLVLGDTNGSSDIFVRDLIAGTTTRVSVDSAGGQALGGSSFNASLSSSGRFVSFMSSALTLVPGDTNGHYDIFLHDRGTGATTRVSVDSNGAQANHQSIFDSISADGSLVCFDSAATNLVSGDTNSSNDTFVHDVSTGTTTRVSVDSSGAESLNGGEIPTMSGDGRFVAFQSISPNLVPDDSNFLIDAFLHDRQTGVTTRVSVDSLGAQAPFWPYPPGGAAPSVSGDGQYVAFWSESSALFPVDVNSSSDVLVRGPEPFPPYAYCVGNALAACPCGPGAIGHGCPNSIYASGALLAGSGSSNVSADTLSLNASSMSGFFCLFFQGTGRTDEVNGDGKLCVSGSLLRIGSYTAVGGAATNPSGAQPPISVKGAVPASGATRFYQAVYRNSNPAFCSPDTLNRTNGLAVVWYP